MTTASAATAGQGLAYCDFHRRSLDERDAFWAEQSRRIEWRVPPQQICDDSRLPFARWFVGGTTNLCHNAIDRHLASRSSQPALVYVSTEVDEQRSLTFAELHVEVNRAAAAMRSLGVARGDRVLIYMPMIPEAVVAMLACVRIGAIHSVVFGGFASHSLAARIDDAHPRLVVSADAGSRAGKMVEYKPLLDEAIGLARHKPAFVLLVDRGLASMSRSPDRDLDWRTELDRHAAARIECEWLESNEPSYVLYTSGTTGKPKGVQRDTGGYAVALAASIEHVFCSRAGDTFFATSDIGWVVGHSYTVYGPLLAGMTTILYEGTPVRGFDGASDGAIWWKIVEKYRVNAMFTAPTAIRVLKKHDPALLRRHDLSSLRALYLAGEPLDEPTARWIADGLGKPIIDNYWQTETGWPILAVQRGIPGNEAMPARFGSPGQPCAGYDVRLVHEQTGEPVGVGSKGVLTIVPPLPPGGMTTIWRDDDRFVRTYFSGFSTTQLYSTFDWGIRDADGYYYVLGRTDDVINVAGHRLGTREIEESLASHPDVAEVAVVGVADPLKGQVPVAFAVPRDSATLDDEPARLALEGELMRVVDRQLGGVARPARVHFVAALPKTRSGKLLRRAIQAVCEGRDPGDLTTIEDPSTLQRVSDLIAMSVSRSQP